MNTRSAWRSSRLPGINLDQLDIHLGAMAGVLGRFRKELIDAGFAESEAAALALEWWRLGLTEEE